MMRFTDIVSLSFLNLRLHKTRSLLTSLGVIFGAGSGAPGVVIAA